FDIGDLLRRKRSAAEIKRELFGSNVGTFLDGVFADNFVQCPMKQMGYRMVALDGRAARAVNNESRGHSAYSDVKHPQLLKSKRFFRVQLEIVHVAQLDRIYDRKQLAARGPLHLPSIPHLTPHFGIERRYIRHSNVVGNPARSVGLADDPKQL